jgi:hypothetical protein
VGDGRWFGVWLRPPLKILFSVLFGFFPFFSRGAPRPKVFSVGACAPRSFWLPCPPPLRGGCARGAPRCFSLILRPPPLAVLRGLPFPVSFGFRAPVGRDGSTSLRSPFVGSRGRLGSVGVGRGGEVDTRPPRCGGGVVRPRRWSLETTHHALALPTHTQSGGGGGRRTRPPRSAISAHSRAALSAEGGAIAFSPALFPPPYCLSTHIPIVSKHHLRSRATQSTDQIIGMWWAVDSRGYYVRCESPRAQSTHTHGGD